MKQKRFTRKMSLLDAVTSSLTDPYGTMEHLLHERETPPFIFQSLVLLIILWVVPILVYQYRYNVVPAQITDTYAIVMATTITFLFFVMFMVVLLRIVGVTAPVIKVLAAVVYAMTPFIPLLIGYYIGNVVTIGSLTITTYAISGRRVHGDWFLSFFPYFMMFGCFFSYMVLAAGIRIVGRMGMLTGLLFATLAIPLLLGAYFIGALCTESVFPYSAKMITKWITSFVATPPS